MTAWVIVPKGTGDIAERVAAKGKRVGIALTLFVDAGVAQKAFDRLRADERLRAELVCVEVTIR